MDNSADQNITIWQTDAEIIRLIGLRIQKKRLLNNITQDQLAYETGLSRLTIHKIENGQGPKLDSLVRILRFFGELDKLDQILKAQKFSPKELYKNQANKQRQRARKKHD